jgi:hypothetical protein
MLGFAGPESVWPTFSLHFISLTTEHSVWTKFHSPWIARYPPFHCLFSCACARLCLILAGEFVSH